MTSEALPVAPAGKLAGGVNDKPFNAALMAAMVPVKVIVVSPVPSPAVNVRPAIPLSEIVPLLPVSVTCTGLVPASGSLIEIRLLLPALNKRLAPSVIVCVAEGMLLTGGSLTGPTVTATEPVA